MWRHDENQLAHLRKQWELIILARGTLPNGLASVGAGLEKRICFAYPPHSERDDGCAMIDLWRLSESVAMTPRRETMAKDTVTQCDLEALWGDLSGGA